MDSKSLCYAKSPIPVFNSNSPPNYVIMPTLLDHVDRTTTKTSSQSPVNTYSQCAATNMFNNFKIHIPTCSKEIIYKSKRTRQMKLSVNSSGDLETGNKVLSLENDRDVSLLNASFPYSLPSSSPTKSVYKINNPQTNNQFIKKLLINNLVKINSPKLKTVNFNNYTELLTSTSSNDNFESYDISSMSMVSNEENFNCNNNNKIEIIASSLKSSSLLPSNSISNSFISSSYLDNVLSEQRQNTYELNNRNQINLENCSSVLNEALYPTITILSEGIENHPKDTSNKDEEHLTNDTYTITYPSEWQSKVNRMINCYVLLKKIDKKKSEHGNTQKNDIEFVETSSKNQMKLKCGVCRFEFSNLDDLLEHKEQNQSCKNEINFFEQFEPSSLNSKKSKRKKKDFPLQLSNHRHKSLALNEFKRKNNKKIDYRSLKNINNNFYLDEDSEDLDDLENSIFEEKTKNSSPNKCKIADLYKNSYKNQFFSENDTNNTADSSIINENEESYSNLENDNYVLKLTNNERQNDEDKSNIEEDELKNLTSKLRRSYKRQQTESTNNLTCEKCNKGCRTKAELLVHMHKHSGNQPFCWFCQKKCASFSNLISHIQLHTGEKPFTCHHCGKQFTQDAHLTRHIRLHTGERPFICSLCGKTYKDYSYYKTHLRIHRGERLYKCNYCEKEYYDASYYKKHTRLHTGEKPYMCTVCGKQFHRSDYLKLHSYSHTSERPFTCTLCGKGFKMNYNLKLHLKSHDVSVSLLSEEKDEEPPVNNNLNMLTYNENINNNNYNLNFVNSTDKTISNYNNNLINLNLNHPKINSITSIATVSSSNDLNDIIKIFDCS